MSGNIALEDLGDVHIFPRLHCTLNHGGHPSIPFRIFMDHIHSLQRVQSPTWKTHSHLESQFPPEMTLAQSQQNFQPRLKLNSLFTPISKICFKKFSR